MSESATAWLCGATLLDGTMTDISIVDGSIAAIGTAPADASNRLDLTGYVLMPSFVEPHAHLDKALTVSRSVNLTGDLAGAMAGMWEIAAAFTHDDFVTRAEAALRLHLAYGTTVVRSHVDIGDIFGLRALAALVEVREKWRGVVDLELVALMGSPILGRAGQELREALREGADVAGGAPHLDPEPLRATERCFEIAGEFGVPLDLHTDETLSAEMLTVEQMADLVHATGFEWGVTASHCVSLGMQPTEVQKRIAAKVAEAGISVVALPQTNLFLQGRGQTVAVPRGLTAVRALLNAGVTVAAGGDNLRDAFHPIGRGDALEVGALLVTNAHLQVDEALRAITWAGRRALGRPAVALAVGSSADLVAVRAADANEVLAAASPERIVFVGGRVVARTTVETHIEAP